MWNPTGEVAPFPAVLGWVGWRFLPLGHLGRGLAGCHPVFGAPKPDVAGPLSRRRPTPAVV